MKDTKSTTKTNAHADCKKNVRGSVNRLIKELQNTADTLGETEYLNLLWEEVIQPMREAETGNDYSVWDGLDIARNVHGPVLETRFYSMQEAIRKMDVKGIMWLLELLWCGKGAADLLLNGKPGQVDPHKAQQFGESLKHDIGELQSWVNDDVHERIQDYEHEIKKLREEN